ncbi:flagellar hook-basal body complex protein FliE [Gracilibacillus boraciitolerans JCM 21714]|uniref:Flagellar hook-basal body complex protein FliE n=1 Tax=Gracilibacillus boraciitolerans JCM 21714 TaxID=1298598 RepID=W4VFU2_9BACI|nr:flagellar hook-basal body complex protein FliE [Gracilibacillus boraciitolerans]GAE91634.1 flagellar hook-basal body complex protein FliE [Gracilibacillus boraciitolerans JCM 21714]
MNIYSLQNIQPDYNQINNEPKISVGEAQQAFATNLKEAISNINQAQKASDQKTEALAKGGEINDLHDVMITSQKASIMLQTGVQIQKKVVDAYNEIMRLQV